MSYAEALGRQLWDAARALAEDPTSTGRALGWSVVTVTAVTPFPDPTNPPAPAPVGIRGTGTGTGPAGEEIAFVYGVFTPQVGDRALLCRTAGSVALLEDIVNL